MPVPGSKPNSSVRHDLPRAAFPRSGLGALRSGSAGGASQDKAAGRESCPDPAHKHDVEAGERQCSGSLDGSAAATLLAEHGAVLVIRRGGRLRGASQRQRGDRRRHRDAELRSSTHVKPPLAYLRTGLLAATSRVDAVYTGYRSRARRRRPIRSRAPTKRPRRIVISPTGATYIFLWLAWRFLPITGFPETGKRSAAGAPDTPHSFTGSLHPVAAAVLAAAHAREAVRSRADGTATGRRIAGGDGRRPACLPVLQACRAHLAGSANPRAASGTPAETPSRPLEQPENGGAVWDRRPVPPR